MLTKCLSYPHSLYMLIFVSLVAWTVPPVQILVHNLFQQTHLSRTCGGALYVLMFRLKQSIRIATNMLLERKREKWMQLLYITAKNNVEIKFLFCTL